MEPPDVLSASDGQSTCRYRIGGGVPLRVTEGGLSLSGGLACAKVVFLAQILILRLTGKLGTRRTPRLPRWQRLLLQQSLWLLAIPWILGGLYAGRAFISCYVTMLAITSALTIGIVLLLAMMIAANQIGARSVR
jgi:hypothetical protein